MQLNVNRLWPMKSADGAADGRPPATTGVMLVDAVQRYFTLELADGDPRQIPAGTYPASPYKSPKFQAGLAAMRTEFPALMENIDWVLRLENVPEAAGGLEQYDEIHMGNWASDVKGCCIVGMNRVSDRMIGNSRAALADLLCRANAALRLGQSIAVTFTNSAVPT
jgi:hypothetical protein